MEGVPANFFVSCGHQEFHIAHSCYFFCGVGLLANLHYNVFFLRYAGEMCIIVLYTAQKKISLLQATPAPHFRAMKDYCGLQDKETSGVFENKVFLKF
jgi:hypothetical protein